MKRLHLRRVLALATAVLITAVLSTPARAAHCAPFPKLAVWGDYTHARVSEVVASRLNGDWQTYVARLDKRLRLIKGVQAEGKALVLKAKGKSYQFAGQKLAAYVRAAERRLAIVRCLAEEANLEKLQEFETAAGPDEVPESEPADEEVAAVRGVHGVRDGGLDVDIETQCVDGDATFRLTNRGAAWPTRATVSIYRLGAGAPRKIHARRLRFQRDQSVSFRVPAAKNPTGQLGLFVDPSWTQRRFALDRTLNCD